MKLRALRLGLLLAGNTIGLWVAPLILDADTSVSGLAFIAAVAIFTVLIAVMLRVVTRLAETQTLDPQSPPPEQLFRCRLRGLGGLCEPNESLLHSRTVM